MKKIEGTEDLYTDGRITYRRNQYGDYDIVVEDDNWTYSLEPRIVEPDEQVVLRPVDIRQK